MSELKTPPLADKELERIFIEIDGDYYVAEIKDDAGWIRGSLYPITYWANTLNKEKGWSYDSAFDGGISDNLSEARCWFEFLFCWRGVWEGRIYFKDDEYWCEELSTIAKVWDELLPQLKQRIMAANPHDYYDA